MAWTNTSRYWPPSTSVRIASPRAAARAAASAGRSVPRSMSSAQTRARSPSRIAAAAPKRAARPRHAGVGVPPGELDVHGRAAAPGRRGVHEVVVHQRARLDQLEARRSRAAPRGRPGRPGRRPRRASPTRRTSAGCACRRPARTAQLTGRGAERGVDGRGGPRRSSRNARASPPAGPAATRSTGCAPGSLGRRRAGSSHAHRTTCGAPVGSMATHGAVVGGRSHGPSARRSGH